MPDDAGLAPIYRDDPRLQPLIGRGAPFEVEEVEVDGIVVRDFVRGFHTIVDAFQAGRAHADKVHAVYGDERVTFGEVRDHALRVARELAVTFGVRRGDRVAIALRNLPEYVVAFWSAAALGAIVVPLNSWWTGPELSYALTDAGATVVFADETRVDRILGEEDRTADVRIVGVRVERDADERFVKLDDLVHGDALDDSELALLGSDDPVTLLYTSGTTGRPKGAIGTNRSTMANLMNMGFATAREALISRRPPAAAALPGTIVAAPLFHVGGIAGIVGAQMSGMKLVMLHKWDVREAVALAQRESVTGLGGVPSMARNIVDYPGLGDLGLRIRTFPMGGAAVAPDLPKRVIEIFGPSVQLLNGYGSTETTSAVVTNVGVEYEAHPDSVGRPNLTADLRVEDSDGRPLGPGEVGELCFRSPQVVKGYWNDEQATKAAFVDGWFHTGDVGYVDETGFVYVVDRIKDVVIRGGENVYCAEVEAVLFEHPAVADVAVVGLADPVLGERVCAVVVPRHGAVVDLDDLRAFAATRLAAFKCPEALHIMSELPKTATEKVAKHELRRALAGTPSKIEVT